ncbi:hypothetical protein RFY41_07560, partial [Acinetobacter soli]|nr:hypothetical protein [Acinetobacter soli]
DCLTAHLAVYCRHCGTEFTHLRRGQPKSALEHAVRGAIWMHHLLEYAQKRQDPIVDRVLLLSPLIRPAK